MGVYNYFTCTIQKLDGTNCDTNTIDGIIHYLKAYNDETYWALNWDGSSNQAINHWEYVNDLCEFSKQFPEIVFGLEVYGDSGHFKLYFNDGKYQRVEVTFPNFDLILWNEKTK